MEIQSSSSCQSNLNDKWCIYFHDPCDESWTSSSFKLIATIASVSDAVIAINSLSVFLEKGMFFVMRSGIAPVWEDPQNKNGGCFSYVTLKTSVAETFTDCVFHLVGETILKSTHRNHWNMVTGISVCPKKNNCIIRIWVGSPIISNFDKFDIEIPAYSKVMYKAHNDALKDTSIKRKYPTTPGSSAAMSHSASVRSFVSPAYSKYGGGHGHSQSYASLSTRL